jgi:hypothetical protein
MALKPFNSVAGFSVGEVPSANIILANGDITASNATFSGNLLISNANANWGVLTNNLYYANGVPWDLQEAAGANFQIQFNDSNNFAASANFTFNPTTNLLTVAGNIDVASNVTTSNLTVNLALSGNTANFTGNLVAGNLNATSVTASTLTSNITTGTAPLTVSSTTIVTNLNADLLDGYDTAISANANTVAIRNADGNLTANYFIGNGSQLTGIDATSIQNGNSNVKVAANGNVSISVTGTSNVVIVTDTGMNVAGYITSTGNVTSLNADLGNLATANFANFASNVTTSNLTVNLALAGNTANFSGNVIVPNLTVNLALSGNTANFTGNLTAANGNLGNLVIANFVQTGTVLNGNSNVAINANGNIVITATSNSTVTISDLGANIIGYVTANGDGSFGAVKSNSVTAQGGNLTLYAAAGNNYVELRPTGTGQVDVGNFRIQNLADPVNAQDAATKLYVDNIAEGLHVHASVIAVTNDTLANISSGTITYNNGASGVGATLITTGTYTLIDTVNIATVGSRILVKDEINTAHNGIYVYTNGTTLTRAADYDTAAEIQGGDFVFSTGGAEYNSTGWVQIDTVTTVGTDPIVWDQFSGAGTYTAGSGLTLTGTVFSVNTDNITTEIAGGNVVVKANAAFTTPNIGAATGTSLVVTGNIVAANIAANTLITTTDLSATGNILAANISANANLTVNNATVNLALAGNTANFSGNVILNNLTTNLELVGNTANFSGNVVVPNLAVNLALAGNTANFTGNVILNNLTTNLELAGNTANFSGNVVVPNLSVNLALSGNTANFSGNISALNANLGNLATANFFTGTLINGTSNIVVNNNGNIDLTSGGNTTLIVTATGANINGYADVSGNLSAANIAANIANVTNIKVGNTQIGFGTATTTSISANQTISTLSVTGVTGIEFLVKGVDSSGSKYVVATVQAVTDGTSVDFTTFGTVNLGGLTGVFAVNIVGSNVALQVSPSSTNSTVWTTQFRTI